MQSPQIKQQLRPVLTVSQLTGQIKDVVEELFHDVYVVGEVSNAKAYPSGHWYFSLKDKDATLSCVCFRSANSAIKFKLEDGLMLVAQGNLSIYPPKGGYQLVASALEPVGIGEWQLAFEQLRAALEKEGLLDPARKKAIPTVPRRVGVVTSPAAAALRDILSALARRNQNVNVVIAPTRVQGEGSAEEIAQAIRDIQQVPGIDVIIVARGGGSIEDLWSFNTDVVARAVAACPIPIVSGVGHETDITICDLVADLRAPTPTAAAELVAKGSQELFDKYKNLEQKLVFKIEQRVSRARRLVDRLSPINALVRYQGRLKQYQMRVGHHKNLIERSVTHLVKNFQHKWHQKHEKLLALAPTNILNRGFAILRRLDGTVICDPATVQPGEEVQAILKTGSLFLQVASVQTSQQGVADPRLAELVIESTLTDSSILVTHSLDIQIIEHQGREELSLAKASEDDDDDIEPEIDGSEVDAVNGDSLEQTTMESAQSELFSDDSAYEPPAAEEATHLIEQVTAVFDAELAEPSVLAKIFGDELADVENASVIFKSENGTHRLELGALDDELQKDSVPPLPPLPPPATVLSQSPSPVSKAKSDYPVVLGDDLGGGALLINERVERELAVAVMTILPAPGLAPAIAPRDRAPADGKGTKKVAKSAAHQLSLFQRSDDE